VTVVCGDLELKNKKFFYDRLKFTDLFVPLIGYPILNRVEGTSTADLMKHPQHATNDIVNILIDYAKYGLFTPTLIDSRISILTEKRLYPGVMWKAQISGNTPLTLDQSVKKLFDISPAVKEIRELIGFIIERAEIGGNAPDDLLMGVSSNPEEKATKSQLRAKAMNQKLAGISYLMFAEVLKKIAHVCWMMTLERLGVGEKYALEDESGTEFGLSDINGHLGFDVPHLTGMAEREIKLNRLKELMGILGNLGLFQHPQMLPVLYRFLKKISEYSMITEFDEIIPPGTLDQIAIPGQTGQGGDTGDALSKILTLAGGVR